MFAWQKPIDFIESRLTHVNATLPAFKHWQTLIPVTVWSSSSLTNCVTTQLNSVYTTHGLKYLVCEAKNTTDSAESYQVSKKGKDQWPIAWVMVCQCWLKPPIHKELFLPQKKGENVMNEGRDLLQKWVTFVLYFFLCSTNKLLLAGTIYWLPIKYM